MGSICQNEWCRQSFTVTEEDRAMLRLFGIEDEPGECPTCRHQHRRLFSPILRFHRRASDLSGAPLLSIYHPRNAFPVFSVGEWWSDAWDALSCGIPFDFNRPFFPQFAELFARVPKMANNNSNTENCEYSFSCGNAKNVYYSRTVYRSDDVFYSQYITGYNGSICDSLLCQRSSYLYECIQCFDCTSCTHLTRAADCGDCHFSVDLVGCTDCLFCSNLRNKSFYIENRPVSQEEYRRIRAETLDGRFETLRHNLQRFADISAKTIWRNLNNTGSEQCTGDNLVNCVRCIECFNCMNTQDARYCNRLSPSEKCVSAMDVTSGGIGELLFNSIGLGGGNYFMRMCFNCRLSADLCYCAECYSCRDCFGCTGLRNKRYCILNTQYTQEEYEALLPQIITHLRETGEWGRFFPLTLSPFAYNESTNAEEAPLAREEVLKRGWRWQEEEEPQPDGAAQEWPDDIASVTDEITTHPFRCLQSSKWYKITPQELAFYRTMRLPVPRLHPDVRMAKRRDVLTPYMLCARSCAKCGKEMQTSFPPERPEIVYCEECYLREVY